MEKNTSPYRNAITAFNSVSAYQSPIEKLNAWLNAISMMKTEVVDYWNGSEALETMDDELPIVIFIVAMSSVPNLAAELAFLFCYVGKCVKFEREYRILTDVEASINFIVREWTTD
ncbi:MAG: hypothetical protein V2I33_23545 [Kangiellaceae bacterium]|nr:hypothetical protein [Kangiellaceae bacterium]